MSSITSERVGMQNFAAVRPAVSEEIACTRLRQLSNYYIDGGPLGRHSLISMCENASAS